MPLYKEWSPDAHSLAAIWQIEEPEAFFIAQTGLNSHIKHPKKRIEHLCGRYLLQYLRDDFPLHHIIQDTHDKPRLPEDRYFFSISHSYPYVAAVISDKEECGIDIQVWKDNIERTAYMFLSERELKMCHRDARMLILCWCAKEAAYKWWGRRKVDFIKDLPIKVIIGAEAPFSPHNSINNIFAIMYCFDREITLKSVLDRDFALSCIVRHRPNIQI